MICTTLLLPRAEAIILLHHFKWSVQRTQEEWLEREGKVRKAVGLFERPIIETFSDAAKSACGICHENNLGDMMFAISCGHWFCRSCLTGYISEAINEGPKCLAMRCPGSSCDASVGPDMVERLSTKEYKEKFENHLLKSYLISCKEAKWCPAPGCEYAVFSSGGGERNNSSVTCRCLYRFCWNCSNEAHSPVDCCIADEWMSETSAQSENWMIANTKPCPYCKFPLELDSSYTYLKCPSCDYEFCCNCGDNWYGHISGLDSYKSNTTTECKPGRLSTLFEDPDASSLTPTSREIHSGKTGFYWDQDHECRLDESSRPAGFRFDDDHTREIAKKSLEKYNLCYERWVTIESCRANALTDLKLFQEVQLVEMCEILNLSLNDMDFLVEAHLQIVEGWHLLKWTYVYGYFLSEDERVKMPLLEFIQEQAEDLVRRLDKHVEELRGLLHEYVPLKCVVDLRKNLVQLTRVTRTHLDKMEVSLKAGLPEVVFIPRRNPRPMPRLKILQEELSSGTSPSPSPSLG